MKEMKGDHCNFCIVFCLWFLLLRLPCFLLFVLIAQSFWIHYKKAEVVCLVGCFSDSRLVKILMFLDGFSTSMTTGLS